MAVAPPSVRTLDVCIIADVHLGTSASRAQELLNYLRSIHAKTLIIAGDLVELPNSGAAKLSKVQVSVVHYLLDLARMGTKVYYLTGNHDSRLRRFGDIALGNLHIREELMLLLDGKKYWMLHGDQLNAAVRYQLSIKRMESSHYKALRWLHEQNQRTSRFLRLRSWSLSREVNSKNKRARLFADTFEQTAIRLAAEQGVDIVVTAHTHYPKISVQTHEDQQIRYMNPGDWVQSLTALEYRFKRWTIYKYDPYNHPEMGDRLAISGNRARGQKLEDKLTANFILGSTT